MPVLSSERLVLSPLEASDADELAPILDDAGLHNFTGGEPATLEQLRRRYEEWSRRRSQDGDALWLNWVARRKSDGRAIGTLQVTIVDAHAYLAWVIARPWQNRGYATESARSLVAWLGALPSVHDVAAHIHRDHEASARVAAKIGLCRTDLMVDGECVWRLVLISPRRASGGSRRGRSGRELGWADMRAVRGRNRRRLR
jgi:RimJ/RimL family protein N-acetyltransferase